jgi:hypothetical protein
MTDSVQKWCQLLYNQAVAGGWATPEMEPNGGETYQQTLIRINQLYYSKP